MVIRENVKKLIKDLKQERQFGPLPLYLSTNTYNGYRKRGHFLGKRLGPVGNTDHRRRGQSTHSIVWRQERWPAANLRRVPTIIDGVEVKVADTVRIKRLLEIKVGDFQAGQIQVSGKGRGQDSYMNTHVIVMVWHNA